MCVEYFPVPSSLSKVFVAPWEPGRKEIDTTREFDTVNWEVQRTDLLSVRENQHLPEVSWFILDRGERSHGRS